MKLDGKQVAALAHLAVVLLAMCGVIVAGQTQGAEQALSTGITAAAGLASSAAVFWKLIHHHDDGAGDGKEE